MRTWLLVLFLTDPRAMPVSVPVESLEACRALAPVQAYHLETTGRAVAHVRCEPIQAVRGAR